jgi:hypothetical protein
MMKTEEIKHIPAPVEENKMEFGPDATKLALGLLEVKEEPVKKTKKK